LDGQPVGGNSGKNPFPLVVIPDKAAGEFSTAFGPGLEKASIGGHNTFTVQLADKFGNKVTMGGCNVGGKLKLVSDSSEVPIQASDNGDGTYTCSYPAISKAGKYEVVPTVEGGAVKGAPFRLTVNPGLHSLDNTLVSFDDHAFAGLPGAHVKLRDNFGNILFTGGEIVDASLLPLDILSVSARDKGDGSYDLIYPPDFRGEYKVNVKVNDQPAPGGPWKVDVQPNPLDQETKAKLHSLVPKHAKLWERLLLDATNSERQLLLKELTSLVTKAPFEMTPAVQDLLLPEPVITLAAGEGAGGFSKPKKPGARAPTGNIIQERQEIEKHSQEVKQEQQKQEEPQQKKLPAGARAMPGMGMGIGGAFGKMVAEKGRYTEGVAVEGKGKEVPEVKLETAPAAGPKFSYGLPMGGGDPRAALKKAGTPRQQDS